MDFATLTQHIINKTKILCGIEKFNTIEILSESISQNSEELLKYFNSLGYHFKHDKEVISFVEFIGILINDWGMSINDLAEATDFFLFDYSIPQISKEFDLLRFGENYNINIELKSQTTPEAQKKQLQKNVFYLNFLPSETKYYSISPTIKSYLEYDANSQTFREISPMDFISVIKNQEIKECTTEEANNFFDIKNYLVSPFNNVEKFLSEKYFLNDHQNNIVDDIIKNKSSVKYFGIKGHPGTGKTLLIYHIAKQLKNCGKKVVILHGAKLNSGQSKLICDGYDIHPVWKFNDIIDNHKFYDYIILDEAQRLRKDQIEKLFDTMPGSDSNFIISLDGNQTLGRQESKENAESIIEFIKSIGGNKYSLKDKFRSNPEMSNFIKLFLKYPLTTELKKSSNKNNNIMIKYFENRDIANKYLIKMETQSEWNVLNYAKSLHTVEELDKMVDCGKISHDIIGQEFDNVIIPMDYNFYYKKIVHEDKEFKFLDVTYSYYPLRKMLYQNITRTRNRIQIVVIENYELFDDLCSLISQI